MVPSLNSNITALAQLLNKYLTKFKFDFIILIGPTSKSVQNLAPFLITLE